MKLTPEQIEQNRLFCARNKIVKKRKEEKNSPVPSILSYIIENAPCMQAEIVRETGGNYVYDPTCKRRLKQTGKVDYCPKMKVWYLVGHKPDGYARATKRDMLISFIKLNKRITVKQAREVVGHHSSRAYLSEIKKEGLVTNPARGIWEWAQ